MVQVSTPKFGMGQPVKRLEDNDFLTGQGTYTDDLLPEGCLHGFVLRSPVASASFTIDADSLADARAADGVHLVVTAEDLAHLNPLPCLGTPRNGDGSAIDVPAYPILAHERVRHVGDAVAFIVAEHVDLAKSAAEMIFVDFDMDDAIVDLAEAAKPGARAVWPDRANNIACDFSYGVRDEGVQRAFDTAAHVVLLDLVNNRLVTNYLETRAVLATYDPACARYTVTLPSQGVHGIKRVLAQHVFAIDPERVRVITPDVGGGFGTKSFVFREYPLAMYAAEQTGRPVKWSGERTEHFLSDSQGRDNLVTLRGAFDETGRLLVLEADLLANLGAYLSQVGPFVPYLGMTMLPGLYDIAHFSARVRGVYTHTVPVDAYRGAGRPEASYAIERFMDYAARQIGMDPVAIRQRNLITPAQLPYKTATGRIYDSGDFTGHMQAALEKADHTGFPARLAKARALGKLRGFGFASYIEACAFAGKEGADMRLLPDGRVEVRMGTQSNGQGHKTAYAQMAADQLGLPPKDILVLQGDTDALARGGGTGGSRSIPIGGAAVHAASETLATVLLDLAQDHLEASAVDLMLRDGHIRVAGTDKKLSYADLMTRLSEDERARLHVTSLHKQEDATYPNGTHVVEVEIDPETGVIAIVQHVVVDDYGAVVNPLLLEGQVQGGAAQGIGQALHEYVVYDETGQLLTASFMDYAMPRASDMPNFSFETRNIPCAHHPLGLKGAGEAGTIGATPAVMNAVQDALWRAGVQTLINMPARPETVWRALASRST